MTEQLLDKVVLKLHKPTSESLKKFKVNLPSYGSATTVPFKIITVFERMIARAYISYLALLTWPLNKQAQGIYNHPGINCKNGRLEIAARIINRFYLADKIFAQFFLLDESCIYSVHVGTKLAIVSIVWRKITNLS